jgi:hypothetical protein
MSTVRPSLRDFLFPAGGDVRADIVTRYGFEGDLLDIYAGNTGPAVHKWHHYLPIYERHFGPRRGTPVRFLEIGVAEGGSLQMWRRWLGDDAVLFGIDVNPACAALDGQAGQVRIGSQGDPTFLASVVAEMGGVDVVLDDGSHQRRHIMASLKALLPQITVGGIYMIEDLSTAYLASYGGGYRAPGNFFNVVRNLIDDMHRWYHSRPAHYDPSLSEGISGVHVYDSVVVLDKGRAERPTHSRVGGGGRSGASEGSGRERNPRGENEHG